MVLYNEEEKRFRVEQVFLEAKEIGADFYGEDPLFSKNLIYTIYFNFSPNIISY